MRKSKINPERSRRIDGEQGRTIKNQSRTFSILAKVLGIKGAGWFVILIFAFCILNLIGCVVRTYKVTKDRADQNLTAGNRGYLQGEAPATEGKERKTTRTTRVVELELHPIIKFEKFPKEKPIETTEELTVSKDEDREIIGNRGYIMQSETPVIAEPLPMEKYTVQKGDTLQKISKKFYGTSKKWTKIYEANKDVLRGPDKIYPDQVINIPTDKSR